MNDRLWKVVLPLVGAAIVLWLVLGPGGGDAKEEARIRAQIEDAIAAWEARDYERFMSFFARDFKSRNGELTYGTLLLYHKRYGNEDYRFDARLENIEIKVDGDSARVRFDGRATGTRPDGSTFPIVPRDSERELTPIVIELRKVPKGGGLSHSWEAISSAGIAEAYGGEW